MGANKSITMGPAPSITLWAVVTVPQEFFYDYRPRVSVYWLQRKFFIAGIRSQ